MHLALPDPGGNSDLGIALQQGQGFAETLVGPDNYNWQNDNPGGMLFGNFLRNRRNLTPTRRPSKSTLSLAGFISTEFDYIHKSRQGLVITSK